MCIEFAVGIGQAAFGGGDAPSKVDDFSFRVYSSGLCCDGSQVVDFEFQGGVACSGWEHGLYGATERGVQERGHDASMHCAKWVVVILGWLGGKDDSPLAYLCYPHTHQDGDGWRGKLT